MKKEKLERDEGKKHFHVTSSQLILGSKCFEKSFSRIHETSNSNSFVSCCLQKGKNLQYQSKLKKCVAFSHRLLASGCGVKVNLLELMLHSSRWVCFNHSVSR